MIIHVHRGLVPFRVWLDHHLYLLPTLPVIHTLKDMDWRGRVALFHKCKNSASPLINRETTTLESRLGDHDLLSPGPPRIFAETSLHTAGSKGGYHRPINPHHDVGETLPSKHLSQLHRGFTEMSINLALSG